MTDDEFNEIDLEKSPLNKLPESNTPYRKLVNHFDFFRRVLDGTVKLANDMDADCFASWKVGGQDFYIYGIEKNTDLDGSANS